MITPSAISPGATSPSACGLPGVALGAGRGGLGPFGRQGCHVMSPARGRPRAPARTSRDRIPPAPASNGRGQDKASDASRVGPGYMRLSRPQHPDPSVRETALRPSRPASQLRCSSAAATSCCWRRPATWPCSSATCCSTSTALMLIIILPVMALTLLLRLALPGLEHRGGVRSRVPPLDRARGGDLDGAAPHHHHAGRADLARDPPARPLPADRPDQRRQAHHGRGGRRGRDETVKPLTVQVVALDWKWLFFYPEQGIATVNELAAPVDVPIAFKITSPAVMNSFFIPALAGQIYAMPGMADEAARGHQQGRQLRRASRPITAAPASRG